MTRFATHTFAAIAAIAITVMTLSGIVTIPQTQTLAVAAAPVLA